MKISRLLGNRRVAGIAMFLVIALYGQCFAKEPATDKASLQLSDQLKAKCLKILREGLQSEEFWPSIHAAEALTLAGQGREVIDRLTPMLPNEKDDQRRCGLSRELVRAGDRSKASVMLDILAKKETNGHTHAAESLYKVAEIGDGRLLREAFASWENPTARLMAAGALARCGNPQALKHIREKLKDSDEQTARIAAWLLARIGDATDIPQISKNASAAKDPLNRSFCLHALAALGDPAGQQALRKNLRSEDPASRTYAAVFASEAWMLNTADDLEKLLDDDVLDVRIRAAQSLLVLSGNPFRGDQADIKRDVYAPTKEHPRYTEGAIVRLADGSLLYATSEFFGSFSDFAAAQIIARRSRDGGKTWGEKQVLQKNIGGKNVMSVTLRRLAYPVREGTPIGFFYLVKNTLSDLRVYLRISTDEGQTFGEPIRVTSEPGYHVMNNDRVTLLSSGRLLVPIASTADVGKVNHFVCSCCFSDDGGKTWQHGKGRVDYARRGAMEPEVLELKDGRVLMIMRTQLGHIAASYSQDGGENWSKAIDWGVKAPEAPSTLRRIPSTGDLLLIWNNNYTPGAGHGGKRTPLTAAISSDEGKTWKHVRNLEDRKDLAFSYTSLTFDRGRAVFSYWVDGGKPRRIGSRFRSLPVSWFYEEADEKADAAN